MASNKELFEALRLLEKEKGIPVEYMITQIKKAIVTACRNLYGGNENVEIKMDPEKNTFSVKLLKTVVEEVEDENFEISLEDATVISKRAAVGKEVYSARAQAVRTHRGPDRAFRYPSGYPRR